MSEMEQVVKAPNKILLKIKQAPIWLWASTCVALLALVLFLAYLSQQTPDQFAMTNTPPWNHGMDYQQLLAHHRNMKFSGYDEEEAYARGSKYRQGRAEAMDNYNADYSGLSANQPGGVLNYNEAAGFARRSTPANADMLSEAQLYAQIERNRYRSQNSDGHFVQTASLRSKQDADTLRAQLIMRGFDPFIQAAMVNNQRWYRVRLGPFIRMSDAQAVARELKQANQSAQVIQN